MSVNILCLGPRNYIYLSSPVYCHKVCIMEKAWNHYANKVFTFNNSFSYIFSKLITLKNKMHEGSMTNVLLKTYLSLHQLWLLCAGDRQNTASKHKTLVTYVYHSDIKLQLLYKCVSCACDVYKHKEDIYEDCERSAQVKHEIKLKITYVFINYSTGTSPDFIEIHILCLLATSYPIC